MNSGKKVLLSIGIIFRNDIRSIERCLQALEPLRRAGPATEAGRLRPVTRMFFLTFPG